MQVGRERKRERERERVNVVVTQGDHSGCSLGFVDIKAKVAFQYKEYILLKCSLCFDVNQT